MNKKFYLMMMLCCGIALGANAQFGKLKGLGKKDKDKSEETAGKDEKADAKTDAPAQGDDESETSTSNVTASPKAWAVEFDKSIDWFKLSPSGKLIAAANDALYAVDPATGKVIWKNAEFKNLAKDNYNAIPNSPYVAILTGGALSLQHNIIDVTDGRLVVNSKDLGIKYINKRFVVPSLNGILFSGMDDKGIALVMVDVTTGKKLWTLSGVFESNKEMITARPVAVDGQNMMLASTKRVYKVNTTNGSVVWKADYQTDTEKGGPLKTEPAEAEDDKESTKTDEKKSGGLGKIPGLGGFAKMGDMGSSMRGSMAKATDLVYSKFMILDNMPDIVYYYSNNGMTAFNLATGAPAWSPVKFPDPIANLLQDERGFLVATDDKNAELFLLDYKTGQQKWAPVKLTGAVTAIKLNGNNLAVASAKESGNNMVNVVNINTGKPVSSSALKVSGVVNDIRMADKGLIYRTTKETNIQDVSSGKDLWSSSLSYKEGGGLGVDKGDKTYVWGDNQLYLLDQVAGTYKAIGKGVKFGGGEMAKTIELRDKGIFISSDQNMALFDFDGNLVYHVFQKAPGISTFGKIMNVTTMAVSLSQSASHGFQSGYAGGQSTSTGRSESGKADRWGNLGSAAASDMSRRFKASQDADSYQVILTKVDTGNDSGTGLVRVNKDTGKIEAKVVLDDKKPDYIADDVENLIFYKAADNRIVGYRL